jgi:predicted Fe-Mo cluster-binding NifX family protein
MRKRMKIALPSNGTHVDEHFGHCECFTIFDIDDENKIVSEETLTPPPGCGCKSNIVPQLASMGVSVMLAGNMGGGAVNLLTNSGIKVIRGCSGSVHDVARAWLAGTVNDSGAGCQAHGEGGCPEHS